MIRDALREATRPHHEALEAKLDLLDPAMTLEGYGDLLERFYGFYGPAERAIVHLPDWKGRGFDLEARLKTPLLERDLVALGREARPEAWLPATALPDLGGFAQALGCLYVMEGATLGGQLISRQLNRRFGLTPDSGGAFHASYGPQVGPMWKGFVAFLEAHGELADHEAIITTACQTFEVLGSWLVEGNWEPRARV